MLLLPSNNPVQDFININSAKGAKIVYSPQCPEPFKEVYITATGQSRRGWGIE